MFGQGYFGAKYFGARTFTGSSSEQVVAAAVLQGGGRSRRRRRIFPDGRQAFATEQEAFRILEAYWVQEKLYSKEAAVIGRPPSKSRKIRVLPSEKAEIKEAISVLRQSNIVESLIKRRDEEEAIVLMLLH